MTVTTLDRTFTNPLAHLPATGNPGTPNPAIAGERPHTESNPDAALLRDGTVAVGRRPLPVVRKVKFAPSEMRVMTAISIAGLE